MSIDRDQLTTKQDYIIDGIILPRTKYVRDLDMQVQSDIKIIDHISIVVAKARALVCLILKRCFISLP